MNRAGGVICYNIGLIGPRILSLIVVPGLLVGVRSAKREYTNNLIKVDYVFAFLNFYKQIRTRAKLRNKTKRNESIKVLS